VVFAPQVQLLRSIDGGRTFNRVSGPHHGDHHDLWIDPANPDRMIASNDGGVDLSLDCGKTWYAPPLPISQFYHVSADNAVPYRVMGCMQDLGSASGPSNSLKPGGIGLGDWHNVGGGEAGFAVPDPSDPNIVYAGEYGGVLTRYDNRTKQSRNITVNQWNPSGIDPAKHKYRFQWTAPILVSRHDPKTVYHGGNVLFRTRDGGQTWQAVSKDLTRNDKHKQQWSGGPITGDNTGAEVYCTIFALGESPKQAGVLWAGTDDGKVWLTRDDCKTWTDVTANVPDLPDWGTVQCVEPSPFDAETAYLVVDNHRMDDYRPHVWRTTNFGKTWTRITDGLDPDVHCHAVREDPKKKGQLYLATERGVMTSPNAGKTWKSLQLNLPTVPVHDLVVKGDDLVLGTHGRSIWILDDLTPLREPVKPGEPAHLFSVRPATKWYYGGGRVSSHLRTSTAPNPPRGAVIWYSFNETPKATVKLEILDAKSTVIATARHASGRRKSAEKDTTEKDSAEKDTTENDTDADDEEEDRPRAGKAERKLEAKAGLNRFIWDLTHDGAETIPGAQSDAGNPGMSIPVSPGTYTVRLTVGDQSRERTVEVRFDPRYIENLRATVPIPRLVHTEPRPETRNPTPDQTRKAELAFLLAQSAAVARAPQQAAAQEQLALRVRDDITKLSRTVLRIRALQKQIALRKELLKDNADAKPLLKDSDALGQKFAALEERLHNPKAKITYDIFAARGGAMLYSQLTFLLGNVADGDGPPTKAQQELADELAKRLADDLAAFDKLVKQDVAKLNDAAKKLGVPELYVPPAR
jgi:hypothetical protein